MRTLSESAHRVRNADLPERIQAPSPVLAVHYQAKHNGSIDCRPKLPLVFVAMASAPPYNSVHKHDHFVNGS